MFTAFTKKLGRLVRAFLVFSFLLLLLLIGANFGAVKNEVRYRLSPPTLNQEAAQVVRAAENPSTSYTGPDNRIIIEKIGVDAPIVWGVPGTDTETFLDKGVSQLAEGAQPGENGNLFLTGHSSDYFWKHNPYATVFSLLPKLDPGDRIVVSKNGKAYRYTVSRTEIVTPEMVSIADQTAEPTLTLMTCYPVGTSKKRFVVHALPAS